MQEKLLQFIWQYSLYRPDQLQTTEGLKIQVIQSGTINRDAGPDFTNARIRIGNTILAGNVELHVRTSDWIRHGHSKDVAYHKIILHVVYFNDAVATPPGIPVLQLRDHIPEYIIAKYSSLLQTTNDIPCGAHLPYINDISKLSWLNRLLVERWEEKLKLWAETLQLCDGNWQELFYQQLAKAFGFKVNAMPFMMLAKSLPLSILLKQSTLHSIEALLFGQAGMLIDEFTDEYPKSLQQEYGYLKQKYSLTPIDTFLWKYMRMRPANFPSIRIAQFAAVIHKARELFSILEEKKSNEAIIQLLNVKASDYWDTHYRFDEKTEKKISKRLGETSAQNIIINTLAPAVFLYSHTQGKSEGQERALAMIEDLAAEDNNIIRRWKESGITSTNAAQSQALLQLYNSYCSSKRCLECAIGLKIIRSRPDKEN